MTATTTPGAPRRCVVGERRRQVAGARCALRGLSGPGRCVQSRGAATPGLHDACRRMTPRRAETWCDHARPRGGVIAATGQR